jgi:hypothetical protein
MSGGAQSPAGQAQRCSGGATSSPSRVVVQRLRQNSRRKAGAPRAPGVVRLNRERPRLRLAALDTGRGGVLDCAIEFF